MKALLFTSCKSGRSLGGESGFQVRAASPTLTAGRQAEVRALATYKLPRGMPEDASPAEAPRRLALVDLPSGSRLLALTTYVGTDPDTGRYGNYFFHGVVGDRDEIDPLVAVKSWGSPFWKTRDDDGPTQLPDNVPSMALVSGPQWEEGRAREAVKRYRKPIEFLLHGLLTTEPDRQRLFLAAAPDVAAECIFALFHALPEKVRAGVTFSTFEHEPMLCKSKVVASCWKPPSSLDLDPQCYTGSCHAHNTFSGRQSANLPPQPEFVAFALDALAIGSPAEQADLRRFLQKCDALGVADGRGVALLHRLIQGKQPLAAADVRLDEAKRMADELVAKRADELVPLLADAALADESFRTNSLPAFLPHLLKRPQAARALAELFWRKGFEAARSNDLARTKTAWQVLLPQVDPNTRVGSRLLDECREPRELPIDFRLNLLPEIRQAAKPPHDGAVARWLRARPGELAGVLAALADDREKREVAAQSYREADPFALPPEDFDPLSKAPAFALGVLGEVARTDRPKALELFKRLARFTPRTDWASELLQQVSLPGGAGAWGPELLDNCLAHAFAQETPRRDLSRWAERFGDRARVQLAQGESPVVLARLILGSLGARWPQIPGLKNYMAWVSTNPAVFPRLEPAQQGQLHSQFGISSYCENPEFSDEALKRLASLMQALNDGHDHRQGMKERVVSFLGFGGERTESPREANRGRLVQRIADGLLDDPDCQTSLENVLFRLGPVYPDGSWVRLFEDVLARCEKKEKFWTNRDLLSAFVSVGTGFVRHTGLSTRGREDPRAHNLPARLSDHLRSSVQHRTRSNPAGVTELWRTVSAWPKENGWHDWKGHWQGVLKGEKPDVRRTPEPTNKARNEQPEDSAGINYLFVALAAALGAAWFLLPPLRWHFTVFARPWLLQSDRVFLGSILLVLVWSFLAPATWPFKSFGGH